jgi:aminoglycoside phosphotransferase family enzyme/predicted kinase
MSALLDHERLIAGLLRPQAYPHSVAEVQRLDTHISTVLLAGDYAYKLKKPVALGFADFSTLALRRHYCEEELRLNRRTAPQLYLGLATVRGARDAPSVDGTGPVLEVAVRMRRFDNALRLDRLARRGVLQTEQIDALAEAMARFHEAAAVAEADSDFGTPATVQYWPRATVAQTRVQTAGATERARLDALAAWIDHEGERLDSTFATRRAQGRVRECHGDLHLANIVLLDGVPTPFDAIEFNPALRWIDVLNDLAFAFMDLHELALPALAWRLVSRYLEHSGDYAGLALLRYTAVYRALVRARVAQIHEHQAGVAHAARVHEYRSFKEHLSLAEALTQPPPPLLVALTGLSGSGKSTVALALAQALGGVQVRSDVERKRLHGLDATARSNGAIYGAEATARTYDRLVQVARWALAARVPIVVDAAALLQHERRRLQALAADCGAQYALVSCEAPPAVLRARIAARAQAGDDPSEATVATLEQQLQWQQPLGADERPCCVHIDTAAAPATVQQQIEAVAQQLQPAPR